MALSKKDIDYIAHLARLDISSDEAPLYTEKLTRILEFIDELDKVDTNDLLPMAHSLDISQRLRADEANVSEDRDLYQKNADVTSQGLYLVPRVIE